MCKGRIWNSAPHRAPQRRAEFQAARRLRRTGPARREREHGTLQHLLVTPLTPFEIMTAKIWAVGLVVLAACALSLAFIVPFFEPRTCHG
jgi:ABC-type multidrug transport system permease subunit